MKTNKEIFENFIYNGKHEPFTAKVKVVCDEFVGVFEFDNVEPSVSNGSVSDFICWDNNQIQIDFNSIIIEYPTDKSCIVHINGHTKVIISWR